MNLKVFLVLILHFLKNAHGNYLECYVCEDCEENEGHPVSCALLGELHLIDSSPHTTNGTTLITASEKESATSAKPTTYSQASAESSSTQSALTNYGTTTTAIEAAFETTTTSEGINTTATTLKENITNPADSIPQSHTTSRPQIIVDSMESYEDMEYDFGNPPNINSSQLQNINKNTTDILGLTGSLNETSVNTTVASLTVNNISLIEGYEGDRPVNESSVDSTLILNSTNSSSFTVNTTDILGLPETTNGILASQAANISQTEENSEEYFSDSEEDFPWFNRSNEPFEHRRQESVMLSAKDSTSTKLKQSPAQFPLSKYSKMSYATGRKQVNITYKCYSVQVKGQNKTQINKGCIAVPPKRTACELLALKYGEETLKDCQACLGDKCNRNYGNDLKFSLKSLLSAILVAWLLN